MMTQIWVLLVMFTLGFFVSTEMGARNWITSAGARTIYTIAGAIVLLSTIFIPVDTLSKVITIIVIGLILGCLCIGKIRKSKLYRSIERLSAMLKEAMAEEDQSAPAPTVTPTVTVSVPAANANPTAQTIPAGTFTSTTTPTPVINPPAPPPAAPAANANP